MGLGGINLPQLLVILAIVLLVFGTNRMKSLGSDLGGAIRGFRRAMENNDDKGGHHGTGPVQQERIELSKKGEPTGEIPARTGGEGSA